MSDDIRIYWTDNLNPPRTLRLGDVTEEEDAFQLGELRAAILDIDPDLDIRDGYKVVQFSRTSGYNWGAGFAVAAVGSAGAIYNQIEPGSKIVLSSVSSFFQRQGNRSNFDYSVRAEIGGEDNETFIDFTYRGCRNPPPSQRLEGTISFPGPFVHTLQSSWSISVGRTGGFAFYYPCRWWGNNGPTLLRVRTKGTLIVPMHAALNPDRPAGIRVEQLYPL